LQIGTQIVVSVVSCPCFQWVTAEVTADGVLTQIICRQHVVSIVVSFHSIAAVAFFGNR
jgi:hypothetical protein